MQHVIILNSLEGVELILKALRERSESLGCVASSQLANGIESSLWILEDGVLTSVQHQEFEKVAEEKTTVPFACIPGGKSN